MGDPRRASADAAFARFAVPCKINRRIAQVSTGEVI
jgi:hypothetical protein